MKIFKSTTMARPEAPADAPAPPLRVSRRVITATHAYARAAAPERVHRPPRLAPGRPVGRRHARRVPSGRGLPGERRGRPAGHRRGRGPVTEAGADPPRVLAQPRRLLRVPFERGRRDDDAAPTRNVRPQRPAPGSSPSGPDRHRPGRGTATPPRRDRDGLHADRPADPRARRVRDGPLGVGHHAYRGRTAAPRATRRGGRFLLHGGTVVLAIGLPAAATLSSRVLEASPVRAATMYSLVINLRSETYAEALTVHDVGGRSFTEMGPCAVQVVDGPGARGPAVGDGRVGTGPGL